MSVEHSCSGGKSLGHLQQPQGSKGNQQLCSDLKQDSPPLKYLFANTLPKFLGVSIFSVLNCLFLQMFRLFCYSFSMQIYLFLFIKSISSFFSIWYVYIWKLHIEKHMPLFNLFLCCNGNGGKPETLEMSLKCLSFFL